MGVVMHTIQEKRLMLKTARSFQEALSQYLTPQTLETSPSGLAANAGGFAVDAATLVLGLVDHDLVLRRFARRTLRHGPGLLRLLPSKTASPRRFPARVPDGPGPTALARHSCFRGRAASAVGPAFR